jgi:hypothetical protein
LPFYPQVTTRGNCPDRLQNPWPTLAFSATYVAAVVALYLVSRFPVNRQSFRTYHLPQVTGIFPALSATLFGVCSCVTYRSCVFWGTLFGESLCLLRLSFFFFFRNIRCVVCSCVLPIYLLLFFAPHNTHHLQVTVSGYFYFNDLTLL